MRLIGLCCIGKEGKITVGEVFFAFLVLADLVEEAEPPDVELAEDLDEFLKKGMFC